MDNNCDIVNGVSLENNDSDSSEQQKTVKTRKKLVLKNKPENKNIVEELGSGSENKQDNDIDNNISTEKKKNIKAKNEKIKEEKTDLVSETKIENNEEEIEVLENNRKKQMNIINKILNYFKSN